MSILVLCLLHLFICLTFNVRFHSLSSFSGGPSSSPKAKAKGQEKEAEDCTADNRQPFIPFRVGVLGTAKEIVSQSRDAATVSIGLEEISIIRSIFISIDLGILNIHLTIAVCIEGRSIASCVVIEMAPFQVHLRLLYAFRLVIECCQSKWLTSAEKRASSVFG